MSPRAFVQCLAAFLVLLVCTAITSGCRSTDKAAAVSDTADEASLADLPDRDANTLPPRARWKIPDDATGIGPLSNFVVPVSAERPASAIPGEIPLPGDAPFESSTQQASYAPALPRIVEHIRADEFDETVLTSDVPVLVDFYMDRCGPCNMLAPILDELARETPEVRVVKVNATRSKRLRRTYGVDRFPTVMVFQEGRPVSQHVGLTDRQTLEQMLAR